MYLKGFQRFKGVRAHHAWHYKEFTLLTKNAIATIRVTTVVHPTAIPTMAPVDGPLLVLSSVSLLSPIILSLVLLTSNGSNVVFGAFVGHFSSRAVQD